MNADQHRLADAINVTMRAAERLRHSLRADRSCLKTAVEAEFADDPSAFTEVDAFVQRYQQIVEHVTHRLFGAIYRAEELGDRPPPLRRLFAYLESLELIDSATWKVRIEIRNRLVHEYPLDPADRVGALNDAMRESIAIIAEIDDVLAYVKRKKLLEPSS